LPEIHRVLVDSTHAMSDGEFGGLFAMSQAAPGTNVMFVTVLGWQFAGLPGAFTTTASFLIPTGLILATAMKLATGQKRKLSILVFGTPAFLAVTVLQWPLFAVVGVLIPLSFVVAWRLGK